MCNILVLNGPNLNLQGIREPLIYGSDSLKTINQNLKSQSKSIGYNISFKQSNSESALIDIIQQAMQQKTDAMLINLGAFSHTSIAIRDALIACNTKFIEIHLSNLAKRESFRHNSYLTDIALGCIMGLGSNSYYLGLKALQYYFNNEKNHERQKTH